jgi:hypothetical protein
VGRFFVASLVLSPLVGLGAIVLSSWLTKDVLGWVSAEDVWAGDFFGMVAVQQPSRGAVLLAWSLGAVSVAAANLLLHSRLSPRAAAETVQPNDAAGEASPRS